MHPQQPYAQQPYAQQPAPQLPHQPPNPYQPYGSQSSAAAAAPVNPSGITAITGAVLGFAVGLAWIGGLVGIFLSLRGVAMDDVLGALVTMIVLVLPVLIGAIGVLARLKFGRVMLIVGLALAVPVAGLMAFAPDAPHLFGAPVFVGAVAGILLTSVSTTGRYIRAAKRYTAPARPVPYQYGSVPPPQAYPQAQYPQQPQYPQPVQPQQPQYPQQGMPPGY